MSLTVSVASRDKMLAAMLKDGETYHGKVWMTIMASSGKLVAYSLLAGPAAGALSNVFGYLGVTDQHLNIVTIDSVNVEKETGNYSIALSDITSLKIKSGLFGRKVILLETADLKLKISITVNALMSDIKDQKENRELVLEKLASLN